MGQFKIIAPSVSMDNLLLENAGLKTREVNLTRIAVGSVIISVILLACYLFQRKAKEKGSSDRKSGRK